MGDSDSPEISGSKETNPKVSWLEIRNSYLKSSYSETYEAFSRAAVNWERVQDVPLPAADRDRLIKGQIAKAMELPAVPRKGATTRDAKPVDKISTAGDEMPPFGERNITRIYIGVDPTRATDAYVALLDSLEESGVLKDIDASLNMEELREGKLTGNMMIVYDPFSRPEVLGKVIESYRNARQKYPDRFDLTPQQKSKMMRWNLRFFHATIDANVSFVEQPALRKGRSFDTEDRVEIQKAFGMSFDWFDLTDEQFIERTKRRENGVVYDAPTRYRFERQQIKQGDILKIERKLSAPAIIQESTVAKR